MTNGDAKQQTQWTYSKQLRLLRSPQFRRVFDAKQSVADRQLIIYARENDRPYSRLGLAVSKKAGNAVVRNRWKRRIREAFRLQRAQLPHGLDLIVLPKRGANPEFAKIHRSLGKLVVRLAESVARKQRP